MGWWQEMRLLEDSRLSNSSWFVTPGRCWEYFTQRHKSHRRSPPVQNYCRFHIIPSYWSSSEKNKTKEKKTLSLWISDTRGRIRPPHIRFWSFPFRCWCSWCHCWRRWPWCTAPRWWIGGCCAWNGWRCLWSFCPCTHRSGGWGSCWNMPSTAPSFVLCRPLGCEWRNEACSVWWSPRCAGGASRGRRSAPLQRWPSWFAWSGSDPVIFLSGCYCKP